MKLHIQVVQVYQVVLQYKVVVIVVDHSCINHSYYQHFCSNQWLKQALVVYSNNSVFNNHNNKPLSSVLQMSNMKSQIHLMADIRRQKTLFLQYRHMYMRHRWVTETLLSFWHCIYVEMPWPGGVHTVQPTVDCKMFLIVKHLQNCWLK
jgi:hypothetical protein